MRNDSPRLLDLLQEVNNRQQIMLNKCYLFVLFPINSRYYLYPIIHIYIHPHTHTCVFFWGFYSVALFCLITLGPIEHCFNYFTFIISFNKTEVCLSSLHFFTFLSFSHRIWGSFLPSSKKLMKIFIKISLKLWFF